MDRYVSHCKRDAGWLSAALASLRLVGFAVVEGVLARDFVALTRERMLSVQAAILREIAPPRLQRAGELGVLRLMMRFDPHFFRLLELPELLAVIDHTLSETAILHTQNGFVLPSFVPEAAPRVFQNRFHMDFPRVLDGYLASVNMLLAMEDFHAGNGGLLRVVAGSHQRATAPDADYMEANAISIECPAGSMLIFDSTLWHCAGDNHSGQDVLSINHQFTRSWIKQQIDYVRALGDALVCAQAPRTQQLLGWYTRVVTSLDEYYRLEDERLYRKGQG